MRRLLAIAMISITSLVACGPPAVAPPPPADRWLEVLKRTIDAAIDNVFGHPPSNQNIDCSVVLFDQSIDPATFKTFYTPVHWPNDIYSWITGCLGVGSGSHTVPTFKASGYPNTPHPDKRAVCWATSFPPDGTGKFPCAIDRDPHLSWVLDLRLSRDGEMRVGITS